MQPDFFMWAARASIQMVKDIQLVADDLKIYYKGFVVALDETLMMPLDT